MDDPVRVALDVHRFGRTSRPGRVVARARAGQVGFDTCEDECGCCSPMGPRSFLVTPRRTVMILDTQNRRVLTWRYRHPNRVERVTRLPSWSEAFAAGPGRSLYVVTGNRRRQSQANFTVIRLSGTGRRVWEQAVPGGISPPIATGPDGAVHVAGDSWFQEHPGRRAGTPGIPIATSDGRPIALPRQLAGTRWAQPLPGGLQLAVAAVWSVDAPASAPHDIRVGLIGRNGRLLRSWRITSHTAISGMWEQTPGVVGADPVIPLTVTRGRRSEHLILRLGPKGVRARLTLPAERPPLTPYGGGPVRQIQIGPGPHLYRLGTSPGFGAAVYRFSLRPRTG